MQQVVLVLTFLVLAMPLTSCSGGDGGGGGSSGDGGSGGDPGNVAGALSLDEDTALPAAAGAAVAMSAAAELGGALGTVFQSAGGAAFSEQGVGPKQSPTLPCNGGGTVEIIGDPLSSVEIRLNDCAGLGLGDEPVSGTITFTVDPGASSPPNLFVGDTTLDLDVGSQGAISGDFIGTVDLARFGSVVLRLGDAKDEDRVDVEREGAPVLTLGCFEITLFFNFVANGVQLSWITPFSAASIQLPGLSGQPVYTISDYAVRVTGGIPQVSFDQFRLPRSGELTLFSGDTTAIDDERSGTCPVFTPDDGSSLEGDGSTVVATFSQELVASTPGAPRGGCVTISGDTFELVTTWEKLLAGDATPGAGPNCFAEAAESEGFEGCPDPGDIEVAADAYVRGDGPEGMLSDTNYGSAPNLLVKSSSNNYFNRKTYLGFELGDAPDSFERALVVLTLDRHVGRRAVDVYGLPEFSWSEGEITWNNAPENTDVGNTFGDGAERLISSDPLDLPPLLEDDPEGTKYAFDITEFVRENAGGSVTVMITNPTIENTDGSVFVSRESEDACARPFLHFE